MPGIVGIIEENPCRENQNDLKLMTDCMMHEVFSRRGSYINEDLDVYIGWPCHPGSFADCMPVINERKDLVLLFSGEHFDDCADSNNQQVIALMQRSDEEKIAFLQKLNGWFYGVLIDLRNSNVTLFNDRYAMQRVYCHEARDAFLFGSEAKCLLRIRPELRELDMRGFVELISCNCVLDGRTLFPKISLLLGGAA